MLSVPRPWIWLGQWRESTQVGKPRPNRCGTCSIPGIALYWQSASDTLFNMNEAVHNVACVRALGGDVRFLTKNSGHDSLVGVHFRPGVREPEGPVVSEPGRLAVGQVVQRQDGDPSGCARERATQAD